MGDTKVSNDLVNSGNDVQSYVQKEGTTFETIKPQTR